MVCFKEVPSIVGLKPEDWLMFIDKPDKAAFGFAGGDAGDKITMSSR